MREIFTQLDWKALWQKYRVALLILLAGVLLMLLPTKEAQEEESGDRYDSFSLQQTQQQMEEILGHIQGTGRLRLMLTLKTGSQLQLAEDMEQSLDETEESCRTETVTINRGGGSEEIVVTRQIYPIYQGALVVCQGADQAAVRLAVTEAVMALTGLSSDKITVVKWNS